MTPRRDHEMEQGGRTTADVLEGIMQVGCHGCMGWAVIIFVLITTAVCYLARW